MIQRSAVHPNLIPAPAAPTEAVTLSTETSVSSYHTITPRDSSPDIVKFHNSSPRSSVPASPVLARTPEEHQTGKEPDEHVVQQQSHTGEASSAVVNGSISREMRKRPNNADGEELTKGKKGRKDGEPPCENKRNIYVEPCIVMQPGNMNPFGVRDYAPDSLMHIMSGSRSGTIGRPTDFYISQCYGIPVVVVAKYRKMLAEYERSSRASESKK